MDFYDKLADYYDTIFPHREIKEQFINRYLPNKGQVLDIGCATGEMAMALASDGHAVEAIDLNDKMVKMAKEKAKKLKLMVHFNVLDMLSIGQSFTEVQFDLIYCIGNTLPHLQNLAQVNKLIKQANTLLKPTGKILIQTVNFDRLLTMRKKELPLIEGNDFSFQRKYEYQESFIKFKAILQDKINNEKYWLETSLLPITAQVLQKETRKAHFDKIQLKGDFSGAAFKFDSQAMIMIAEKRIT